MIGESIAVEASSAPYESMSSAVLQPSDIPDHHCTAPVPSCLGGAVTFRISSAPGAHVRLGRFELVHSSFSFACRTARRQVLK